MSLLLMARRILEILGSDVRLCELHLVYSEFGSVVKVALIRASLILCMLNEQNQ